MAYKDPEQKRAFDAAYRLAHQEQKRARDAAYRLAHQEQRRAFDAAYYLAHQEQKAAYYLAHQEQRRASDAAWKKANSGACRAQGSRRRARKLNAPINDLTAAQWKIIKAHFKHRCSYCGKKPKKLTQDHITPLSKGGAHTMANIVPACRSCNSKKSTKKAPIPVQPLLC